MVHKRKRVVPAHEVFGQEQTMKMFSGSSFIFCCCDKKVKTRVLHCDSGQSFDLLLQF